MATLYQADGQERTIAGPLTLEQMTELVGGYIELVTLLVRPDGVRLGLVVDEEGKLKGKPLNTKATMILHLQHGAGDYIVGDALLVHISQPGTDDEVWR